MISLFFFSIPPFPPPPPSSLFSSFFPLPPFSLPLTNLNLLPACLKSFFPLLSLYEFLLNLLVFLVHCSLNLFFPFPRVVLIIWGAETIPCPSTPTPHPGEVTAIPLPGLPSPVFQP